MLDKPRDRSRQQVNVRLADDDIYDALLLLAVKRGTKPATLAADLVTEGVRAEREGRAMFEPMDQLSPADMQQFIAAISTFMMDFDRSQRHINKKEARLAQQARADTHGVSEARGAIVDAVMGQLRAEMHRLIEPLRLISTQLQAVQATTRDTSSVVADVPAVLTRIERDERPGELLAGQAAHSILQREHTAALERLSAQPRITNHYNLWNKHWSLGKLAIIGSGVWLAAIVSFAGIAKSLPDAWLAVPSADGLMGRDASEICKLVNYRLSTTYCFLRFDPKTMTASIVANTDVAQKP